MELSSRVVVVTGYPENGVSDIHEYMNKVGKVVEVVARKDSYFVLFQDPSTAIQAVKDLDQRQFKDNLLTIRIPLEDEKDILGSMFKDDGPDPMVQQLLTIFGKLSTEQKNQFQNLFQASNTVPPPPVAPVPLTHVTTMPHIPRLPIFSGESGKGEVNFERWKYEVRCLLAAGIPHHIILQAIRHSLKKTPADVLTWRGECATITDILQKLETLYGNVLTGEALVKQFCTESQRPDESVAAWGCRLEEILSQAVTSGSVDKASMDNMLRKKFWSELHDDRLKVATRHKCDLVTSYNQLVAEVRAVEQRIRGRVQNLLDLDMFIR